MAWRSTGWMRAFVAGLPSFWDRMAAMAGAWFLAVWRLPVLGRHWIVAGLLYGVVLWLVMYWVVMPLRWEGFVRPNEPLAIARQLFAHCILVGLPIAWFARRHFAGR